jgi:toxin HigB-1
MIQRLLFTEYRYIVYNTIVNFKTQVAQDIYDGKSSRQARSIPSILHDKVNRLFDQINAATEVETLRVPPSNKLKKLSGKMKSYWSIRVNKQYRVIFKWKNGEAIDVDIEDYH